jgi:hypothetical protein
MFISVVLVSLLTLYLAGGYAASIRCMDRRCAGKSENLVGVWND